MDAKEAREQARIHLIIINNREKEKEKKEIMKDIKSCVDNGMFSHYIKKPLYEETKKYLNSLGYKITEIYSCLDVNSRRFDGTKIEW